MPMMNFSKTLGALQDLYVPGMAAFYDKQELNEWQDLHNAIETAYRSGDTFIFEAVCDKAVTKAKILAGEFIAMGKIADEPDARDPFYTGGGARWDRIRSVRKKMCMVCEDNATSKLKIMRHNDDAADLYLLCADCAAGKEARYRPQREVGE